MRSLADSVRWPWGLAAGATLDVFSFMQQGVSYSDNHKLIEVPRCDVGIAAGSSTHGERPAATSGAGSQTNRPLAMNGTTCPKRSLFEDPRRFPAVLSRVGAAQACRRIGAATVFLELRPPCERTQRIP